ncbi:tigger transposable element-derived protein 6-like [Metopolophium dirhodum]|uniref:tigger transposable element-derived protein 6-like n=1 Tax=Metopolophium dirhodum TaxID=44670 RepID=UPI0029905E4F|nr:tigger transposable element-derived protein 6-like [Metopolophium dirhodum]
MVPGAQTGKKVVMAFAGVGQFFVTFGGTEHDREMKNKKRKILLLIDNCTLHNAPPKLDNIRVEYFPPNCTAVLQPLDQSIIRADNISQSTITNCWKHATTTKDANSVSEVAEYDESNTHDIQQSELEQIWITAKKKTSLPDDVNLEDYLGADDNVLTCYELTEVDIVQSIKDSKDEATDESSGDEDEEAVMGNDVSNVTSSEALSSLEVMRTFITSQSDVPDFIFTNIHQLQNYLLSIKTANLVQKKIVDYL